MIPSIAPGPIGRPKASENRITNGGFETNTTGWSQSNAILTRITTDSVSGSACLRVTWANTSTFYQIFQSATALSGATAGRKFTASCWIKGEGDSIGKAVGIRITESGGGAGAASYNLSPQVTLTADWQRIEFTATIAQDDRTGVQALFARRTTSLVNDESVLVDNMLLEEQAYATPYIHTDGGTASRPALKWVA